MTNIFVYGSLRDLGVLQSVLGRTYGDKRHHVILEQYKKEGLNIVPDLGSSVPGEIIEATEEDMVHLNNYESEGYLYELRSVNIEGFEDVKSYQLIDRGTLVVSPYALGVL